MICCLFEHYTILERHMVLENKDMDFESPYWKLLGLVEIPDNSFIAEKLQRERKQPVEFSEEMWEIVPELNKIIG